MPFYEYKCSNCGHELEELQRMSDAPLKKCPNCGKDTLQKLIGTGGGLIFKGSGFYLTDYKKKAATESDTKTSNSPEGKKESNKSAEKSTGKSTDKPPEKTTSSNSTDTKKTEKTKKEK